MFAGKYSRVYPSHRNPHFGYRYDYEHEVLEYVSNLDHYFDREGKRIDVSFMGWVVINAVALSQEEWDVAPQYWIDFYSGDIVEKTDLKHGNLWKRLGVKKPNFGYRAVS